MLLSWSVTLPNLLLVILLLILEARSRSYNLKVNWQFFHTLWCELKWGSRQSWIYLSSFKSKWLREGKTAEALPLEPPCKNGNSPFLKQLPFPAYLETLSAVSKLVILSLPFFSFDCKASIKDQRLRYENVPVIICSGKYSVSQLLLSIYLTNYSWRTSNYSI